MVYEIADTLGATIRQARQRMDLTQRQLAARLGISRTYLVHIENSLKKPRYDLLFRIIRELNISPDAIFYPEKPSKDSLIEDIVRMLYRCDDHSLSTIRAAVKAETEITI